MGIMTFGVLFIYTLAAGEAREHGTERLPLVHLRYPVVSWKARSSAATGCCCLNGREGRNGACPRCLLAYSPGGRQTRFRCLVLEEVTGLLEPLFDDLNRKALVDSKIASMTLETAAVWLPLDPGLAALLDEAFLVLFGGVSCPPHWFLMEVVLGIF